MVLLQISLAGSTRSKQMPSSQLSIVQMSLFSCLQTFCISSYSELTTACSNAKSKVREAHKKNPTAAKVLATAGGSRGSVLELELPVSFDLLAPSRSGIDRCSASLNDHDVQSCSGISSAQCLLRRMPSPPMPISARAPGAGMKVKSPFASP